jgi:hypothetical protein
MPRSFYRTNPTNVFEIDPGAICIRVSRAKDGLLSSFSLEKVSLDGLGLPPTASVYLAATSTYNELRFDLGPVSTVKQPLDTSLTGLDAVTADFRFFVVNTPDPRIIASCEDIEVTDSIDSQRTSLFVIQYIDLGERLWALGLTAGSKPVIKVHNNPDLGVRAGFDSRDWFVRGLILPAAFEQALFYLLHNPAPDEKESTWQNIWADYLEEIGEEIPDLEEVDTSEALEWCRKVATKFCSSAMFSSQHLAAQEGRRSE